MESPNLPPERKTAPVFFMFGVFILLAVFALLVWFWLNPQVIVRWQTAAESDLSGFNLYRTSSDFPQEVLLNSTPIPALGTALSGAAYEFRDNHIRRRVLYTYRIVGYTASGTPCNCIAGQVSIRSRLFPLELAGALLLALPVFWLLFGLRPRPTAESSGIALESKNHL